MGCGAVMPGFLTHAVLTRCGNVETAALMRHEGGDTQLEVGQEKTGL